MPVRRRGPDVELRELDLFSRDDLPLLQAWAATRAASETHDLGDHASPYTVEELRGLTDPATKSRTPLLAVVGGHAAGAGMLALPHKDNVHVAFGVVHTDPAWRRRGVGSAVLVELERRAVAAGRTSMLLESASLTERDPAASFAVTHGYDLALTSLESELALGALTPEQATEESAYAIEVAAGDVPESWLEDHVVLLTRMSTDTPQGNLDLQEESWDVPRVRQWSHSQQDAGRGRVEAVARDRASGRLVGYTFITVPPHLGGVAIQEDTLVIREHRGHGLGVLLKRACARALADGWPQVHTIRTWNAADNAHMLAVNRALGFRQVAFEREWQKRLARPVALVT